jgi:hypothetical protein
MLRQRGRGDVGNKGLAMAHPNVGLLRRGDEAFGHGPHELGS